MQNGFTYKIEGTKLTIDVDLSHNSGKSKSGKSIVIASSNGNIDVGNDVKLGLNVYKPVKSETV